MPKTILFWPDVYKEQGHWLPTLKWAEDLSKLGYSVKYMGILDCQGVVDAYPITMTENTLDLKKNTDLPIVNRIGVQNTATSTAHHKSGKFDFVFSMDKYKPFEGAGAISKWSLAINGFLNTWNNNAAHNFNTNNIKDVVIHISYTARMGKEIGGNE